MVRTRRSAAMPLIVLAVTVALAAPALAMTLADDGVDFSRAHADEPLGLQGWDLVVWLGIMFWVVQVPIAFLVRADARNIGMNGGFWFAIELIPTVGYVAAVVYILERRHRIPVVDPGPLGTSRQEPLRSSGSPPITGER